jgi:hypothetical protein
MRAEIGFMRGDPRLPFRWIGYVDRRGNPNAGYRSVIVGLCDDRFCDQCTGPPDGFKGGPLNVDLQGLWTPRRTLFFLAHYKGVPGQDETEGAPRAKARRNGSAPLRRNGAGPASLDMVLFLRLVVPGLEARIRR